MSKRGRLKKQMKKAAERAEKNKLKANVTSLKGAVHRETLALTDIQTRRDTTTKVRHKI